MNDNLNTKVMNNTIAKGIATLYKLEEQGEKLRRVETNINHIDDTLNYSDYVVKTMESLYSNVKKNLGYLFYRNNNNDTIDNDNSDSNSVNTGNINTELLDNIKDNIIDKRNNDKCLISQLSLIKEININIGQELDNQNEIISNLNRNADSTSNLVNNLNSRIKMLT